MLRNPLTIHVVGDTNVGKTTFVNRLLNKRVEKTEPNVGSIFARLDVEVNNVNNERVALDVWDTPGAARLRPMLVDNFRTSDLLVAVFDVTSMESFVSLEKMIADAKASQPNIAVMLVVNKMDLIASRQVSEDDINRLSASCTLCVRTNAFDPEASQQIHAGVKRAIQVVIEKAPVSQEFVVVDGYSLDEIEPPVMSKSAVKKIMASHKRYNEIIASSPELTQGIKQLFHDYAHPPLFSFHPNRHHKIRADSISKHLPADVQQARVYLLAHLNGLRDSVKPKFDPTGSMARRLQFAIDKLIPLLMDIQQQPKSR